MSDKNKIDLAAVQERLQPVKHVLLAKIALQVVHVRDGLHGQQVQRDDPPLDGHLWGLATQVVGLAHVLGQIGRRQAPPDDLRPAARGRAQIHHGHAGTDEVVLLVDADELEGGPRPIVVALRQLHVRVVQVVVKPGPVHLLAATALHGWVK